MSKQRHETTAQWTKRNETVVRSIHGTVVGTAVILGAFWFGGDVLSDGALTWIEASFVGGLAVAGFVASMPWIFMPALEKVLMYWQRRRNGDG